MGFSSKTKGAVALVAAAAIAAAVAISPHRAPTEAQAADSQPNILFLLTDDQTLRDLSVMSRTRSLIGRQGVTFDRAYASFPLCCPARVTLQTGQYAHNHGVIANGLPFGGYGRFNTSRTIATMLPPRGYRTIHIGKMPNGYSYPQHSSHDEVPPGWSEFYGYKPYSPIGTCSPSSYFNFCVNEDLDGRSGVLPVTEEHYNGSAQYQTDIYRDKAVDRIDDHFNNNPNDPLFMEVNFFAPHGPHEAAPRHAGDLKSLPLPRGQGFNEKNFKDKPKWLKKALPRRLKSNVVSQIRNRYTERLETLRAVDEAIGQIVNQLSAEGELSNTYVVFTSDNGYWQGQHRIPQGKFLPHEPSSHVPLLIRGPGIPAGARSKELVAHPDIPATFLDIANASPSLTVDGRSLLPFANSPSARTRRPILIASGGSGFASGILARKAGGARVAKTVPNLELEAHATFGPKVRAPRYRALRTNRYLYVKYTNGSRELYDMKRDPSQNKNKWKDKRYKRVKKFMKKRLKRFAGCDGPECRASIKKEPRPLSKKQLRRLKARQQS